MKKIDLIKKLAASVGVNEEAEIPFFEYFVSQLAAKLIPGDSIILPQVGEFYIKKGAIKNEEMDDIDFENTLDIMAYPLPTGDNLTFMVGDVNSDRLNAFPNIFSENINSHPIFKISGNETASELCNKIISESKYNKNLIVGQEYLIIGMKELSVLDAGYLDEVFQGYNFNSKKQDEFHKNLEDALDIDEKVPEVPENVQIEESNVADKILDDLDFEFNESEFEKIDPFNSSVTNRFPVEDEDSSDIVSNAEKISSPIDEFIRITDKPTFTEDFIEQIEPEKETIDSLEELSETEIASDEPELELIAEEEPKNPLDETQEEGPEEQYRRELKKKGKNKWFIFAAGFLIMLLFGLLAYYKFGGKIFNNSIAPKIAITKSEPNVIERKYDIPITYSETGQNSSVNTASLQNENINKPESKENAPKVIEPEKKDLNKDAKTKEPVKKIVEKKPIEKKEVTKKEPNKVIKKEVSEKTAAPIVRQVSAWKNIEQADALVKKYRRKGYNASVSAVDFGDTGKKGVWYRIVIKFKSLEQANNFKE